MAEKKPMIVIKKVTVVAGGAHGGAWKVAFADFMTAMMAFFLVMWLLSTSSEQTKKAVSDYFSTPSVIEYNFSNYGVEITLEKLFLDLVNEPLKTLQAFMDPMDKTPNVMAMGMKKVVLAFLADQLGDVAEQVEVNADNLVFEIPDHILFERGTSKPSGQFILVMEKLKGITVGLEDSELVVTSVVYAQSVAEADPVLARNVAKERLDLVTKKIEVSLESETVDIRGRSGSMTDKRALREQKTSGGYFKFEINQKAMTSDGRKPRPIRDEVFGKAEAENNNVYNSFVKQLTDKKKKK